jgi:dinuclear metal center YbgI/SA1388 family protein
MPLVKDLLSLMESLAPLRLAESWDNCGLMVGAAGRQAHKVALALDPTAENIEAAHGLACQALLAHHPLIFKPLTRVDLDDPVGRAVGRAVELGVTVISAHTNLDAALEGVSWALARRLELTDIQVLAPQEEAVDASPGLGCLGRWPKPLTASELIRLVKDRLGVSGLRHTALPDGPITTAAVMGGSGGGFMHAARSRGAEVFITGDLGYHQARDAEALGLGLIDAGHFATERPVLAPWADRLGRAARQAGEPFEFTILTREEDPWGFGEE